MTSLDLRSLILTRVAPGPRQERGALPVGGGGRGQRRGKPAVRLPPVVPPQAGAVAQEKKMIKVLRCICNKFMYTVSPG